MNLARHRKSFSDLHQQVRDGEFDQAQVIHAFYDEYLAVNDLPAPFYLTTWARSSGPTTGPAASWAGAAAA